MEIGPHVFLFDADADGIPGYYGAYFDPLFLEALSSADPKGLTNSRIKRGDALLSSLAQQVSAVERSKRGQGYTLTHDMRLYKTLIWDLCQSLQEQWHSLDIDEAETILAKHSIHCIMLTSLPLSFRREIDKILRKATGYMGAFEIDPGNPVQQKAFCDVLVYDAFVMNGEIVRELSYEGEKDVPFVGADIFKPNGAKWLEYGSLIAEGPPDLEKVQLSERGAATAALVRRKRRNTIQDRVLQSLMMEIWTDSSGQEYSFWGDKEAESILEAVLPDGKFKNYLFNLDHGDGKGKAKFFIEELAILPDDWRYLAAQFYSGLVMSEPQGLELRRWKEGYGAKFEVDIAVTGRNGRILNVKTGWIMEPGKPPHLSTAYPENKAVNPVEPGPPPIVSLQLLGEKKWSRLFELALEAATVAHAETVPTPLKIEGYSMISEGEAGVAGILVKDARTGFARWLCKSELGSLHYKGGAYYGCPVASQSYDRAKAFATTFVRVLHWNGVSAQVIAHYT